MKTRTCTTCPPARRGAALYLAVMGISLLVSLLGLAGLKLVQLERHQIQQQNNRIAASQYAGTALALAKLKMQNDPNWRTTYANGVESPLYPLDSSGRGTISWRLVDTDGSLSDRDTNLKLLGIGRIGNAVQVSCVDLTVSNALEILNMAVHADGNFTNGSGKVLTVNGAPASSNILVNNGGNLTADVDTVSFSNTGTYTGTAVTDQDVKQMPVSNLFDEYVVLATELTYDGSIDKMLITPSVNQYDTPLNAQGLYYINTGSRGLDIKDSRIQGTLIIDAGSGTVTIGNNVLIEPADTGYATLVIRASGVYLEYDSQGKAQYLDEATVRVNFNPSLAPYEGKSNTDQKDKYPSKIFGLVYVDGELFFKNSPILEGVAITTSNFTNYGSANGGADTPIVNHDPSLYNNPPYGFTTDFAGTGAFTVEFVEGTFSKVALDSF